MFDFLDSKYGCSESNKSNIFAPAGAKINSSWICLFLTFSYLELGKYMPMGLCEGLPCLAQKYQCDLIIILSLDLSIIPSYFDLMHLNLIIYTLIQINYFLPSKRDNKCCLLVVLSSTILNRIETHLQWIHNSIFNKCIFTWDSYLRGLIFILFIWHS